MNSSSHILKITHSVSVSIVSRGEFVAWPVFVKKCLVCTRPSICQLRLTLLSSDLAGAVNSGGCGSVSVDYSSPSVSFSC